MASAAENKSDRAGRTWKGVVLGCLVIVALVWLVDTRAVIAALYELSILDLIVLLGISLLMIGVSVLKWRAFLLRLGITASYWRLYRLYVVGYFVNLFTPSVLGGDVVRSLYVGSSVDRAHAVSATFLERYTGIVAMVCMAVIAVLISDTVSWNITVLVYGAAIACVGGTWILFSGLLNRITARLPLPRALQSASDKVQKGLVWGAREPRLLGKALALSVLFHLLTVVNTGAVGMAIGWIDIPWRGLFIVVPLILLVGALPISPQGLGIQEGAFMFFLHSVGAEPGQALAIALVLRAKSYLLAVVGGVLFWGVRRSPDASIEERGREGHAAP